MNIKIPENLSHIKLLEYDKTGKCKWFCEIHSIEFYKTFTALKRSVGCNICSKEKYKKSRSTPLPELINKFNIVHNFKYDYSNVYYENSHKKIEIICPIHGSFFQVPSSHLSGIGCPKCGNERTSKSLKKRKRQWIEDFIKVHGNKYDYSKISDNLLYGEKIEIICSNHGSFYQLPSIHNLGHGCPKCGIENNITKQQKNYDNVIKDFIKIHGNKYDYSKVEYNGAKNKIEILCKDHGSFFQTPNDHLSGYGCPNCYSNYSKQEEELRNFLDENKIEFIHNVKTIIPPKELDIFIPSKNIAIEMNGVFWHSFNSKETKKQIYRHFDKTKKCNDNNISLIHIFEDQWIFKNDIVKSLLKSKLNLIKNKIYARKCKLLYITNKQFSDFCEITHLQGNRNSKIKIGLFYNNELVCCMGFNAHNKYEWELTRYCSKLNTIVVGGASKIFNYFIKTYNPKSILSFCDISISNGMIYNKLGFKLENITSPNYRYYKNLTSLSRYQCQKHKLHKRIENFNESLSESENMFNNNWRRLWDCGNYKFVWKNNF